ncbi:MAG: ribosome maturation factor RimP [Actinomycetales bacterium]|uniref:Ribosome maturation factor RimP n=1 Tax=Candidatus Phosphoribacter hodrii TaxID=2953743 RepID=A0A934X4U9_9MICO|nr:ribosome maturation factor RimP [Candidatus Phosphoribacter hodrii]
MQASLVRSIVEAPLAAVDLVVEDVTVTAAGRRSVVRIAVDRSLAGLANTDTTSFVAPLSLDEVADATRVVDAALDSDTRVGNAPYVLEVSSPGVDRPLTQPRHLRRNVGRLVRLRLKEGAERSGRIASVSDLVIVLTPDPAADPAATAAGPVEIPVDQVRDGRVIIEFGRIDEVDLDDTDDELDETDETCCPRPRRANAPLAASPARSSTTRRTVSGESLRRPRGRSSSSDCATWRTRRSSVTSRVARATSSPGSSSRGQTLATSWSTSGRSKACSRRPSRCPARSTGTVSGCAATSSASSVVPRARRLLCHAPTPTSSGRCSNSRCPRSRTAPSRSPR